MKKAVIFLTVMGCIWANLLKSQPIKLDSAIRIGMIQPHYQGFMPTGVFAQRFGFTSTAGLNIGYKWANQLYFFTGMSAFFGGVIKEKDILRNITVGGYLIDNEGNFVPPRMQQSGFIVPFKVGKQFPVKFAPNPNSGLYVESGLQFIQHKIAFNFPRNRVPALSKEYRKGYDRLTNGIGIIEAFGYRHFSNNGYWNFDLGIEFGQHFTRNRRAINYDTGQQDTKQRIDILWGFHVGWLLPVWKRAQDRVYEYR